jgi:uncharacterized protein YjiK
VSDEEPSALGVPEEDADTKVFRKEARIRAEQARGLDPRERYRALVDALEEAMDLVELADRKARFALVIMGALNVAFFVVATRSELVAYVPTRLRPFLAFYLVAYAGVALFFFLEAIEALRPRRFRPHLAYPGNAGKDHYPEGLRYHEDVVTRDLEAYRRAWREVNFGQLNAELAVQNHVMARINLDKYRSLRRLFVGLRVLTIMAGGLLAIVALSLLLHESHLLGTPPPAAASRGEGLPPPVRVEASKLREASGIAWHPGLSRLFAVGDRGSLVEMDARGTVVARWPVRGNLEDVAVHEPSGRLVLLAEKKGELVVFDPGAAGETARFALDVPALVGRAFTDRNQGFEGLAFRAEPGRPGGGVFHLVHQSRPATLVALAFDPLSPPRVLGEADVLARHALDPWDDLTAVAWCAPLRRLLVVAEGKDRLLEVSTDGQVEAETELPGVQQEGLAILPDGTLWVADERLGLLRFDGALGVLRAALAAAQVPAGAPTATPGSGS